MIAKMRANCPVDTGVLRQQHQADQPRRVSDGWAIKYRALPYWGVFVHEGHGVIRPVRAKVLRFVTKGGAIVFTKKVRAVAPNPWLYRSFQQLGFRSVRWLRAR